MTELVSDDRLEIAQRQDVGEPAFDGQQEDALPVLHRSHGRDERVAIDQRHDNLVPNLETRAQLVGELLQPRASIAGRSLALACLCLAAWRQDK
jgi:hypothetical protein